jgi:two-component sensor histidine kinase
MERLFLLTSRTRGFPTWARYGATTLLVLLCLGLRFLIFGPGAGFSFLLFFPAVILAGIVFDHGTGIYASLLSSVLAVYFFIEPVGSFDLSGPNFLAVLVFLGITLFTAVLLEALHGTLRKLITERQKLAAANSQLQGVAETRATLLSEAVHRARNDLQRLAATLHVQGLLSGEPAARQALADASDRITALARINTRLDLHRPDGDPEVDSKGFIDGLVEDLRDTFVGLRPIALASSVEAHVISMARAVPLGLIVNELVVNALKYAFPGDAEGRVHVRFQRSGDEDVLSVEDDGIGLDPAAPAQGTGLGTQIIRSLAAQLGGQARTGPARSSGNRPGVRWTICFPVAGQDPGQSSDTVTA